MPMNTYCYSELEHIYISNVSLTEVHKLRYLFLHLNWQWVFFLIY